MNRKVVICGVDTSTLPRITEEESQTLLASIKRGDNDARNIFIISNMRLVLSIIKRFWKNKVNSDDIFQAGMVGLIKSVDNFDINIGVKFSTYAVPMIIGEIKRYLRDVNSMRIPRSIRDMAYQVLKARGELKSSTDEEVTVEMIAKKLNIDASEVTYALTAISDTVSLYEPVYNDKSGDELLLMDQISDEKNTDESWTERVCLYDAINELDERQKNILFLRYFEGRTQVEISEKVGISQAQVSRLEKNALKEIQQRIKA